MKPFFQRRGECEERKFIIIIFFNIKVAGRHNLETFRDYPRPSGMNSFLYIYNDFCITRKM